MTLAVQTHPDRYDVQLFPGDEAGPAFAVVRAFEGDGTVSLFMPSPAHCDELIKAAAKAKRQLLGEQPDWCPAVLDHDDEAFYCDREAGHPGSHHAPGADEGSEIAWGGEPEPGPARLPDFDHVYPGLRARLAGIVLSDDLDDAALAAELRHVAISDGPDCGCGLGAARCRDLEDGA